MATLSDTCRLGYHLDNPMRTTDSCKLVIYVYVCINYTKKNNAELSVYIHMFRSIIVILINDHIWHNLTILCS